MVWNVVLPASSPEKACTIGHHKNDMQGAGPSGHHSYYYLGRKLCAYL